MAKHRISEDSTIYHYTLLYRFSRRHPFYGVYLALLFLWLIVDIIRLHILGPLLFVGSIAAVLILHAVLTRLLMRFVPGSIPRQWKWAYTFPFFGYLPNGYVPITSWNRANRHRLTIGFALIALLYVWLPLSWLANFAAAHYFLILPQLIYVGRSIRINRSGLLKINSQDISLYKN